MNIEVEQTVFASNDIYAEENRRLFREKGIFVVNMISAPGAGKTTVLESLLPLVKEESNVAVIEGDLYTAKDAERIHSLGIDVVQLNTEGACHLDAKMIHDAIRKLSLDMVDLLVIENVGNLVCPAEFDLGEHMKVHIASVTEGNDKPLKYPLIYEKSEAVLLNKVDLLPYTDFDLEGYQADIHQINPKLTLFCLSARTKVGVREVGRWLLEKAKIQGNDVKS